MVLLQRKLYFPKNPEGVQHFPEWVQLFFRGVQMLISIETHINCDFPGGSGPPSPPPPHPPLDLHWLSSGLIQ